MKLSYINTPQIQLFPYSYVFYLCDKKLILYKAKSTSCSEIHLGYVRQRMMGFDWRAQKICKNKLNQIHSYYFTDTQSRSQLKFNDSNPRIHSSTQVQSVCEKEICTLSSPTGPREDFTMLATAWHATTKTQTNPQKKKQEKSHLYSKPPKHQQQKAETLK